MYAQLERYRLTSARRADERSERMDRRLYLCLDDSPANDVARYTYPVGPIVGGVTLASYSDARLDPELIKRLMGDPA